MWKGREILGKPVVHFDTGRRTWKIRDLIFSQEANRLLGFLVEEGGWFKAAAVLPLERVQAIGPDAVVVPSKASIVPAGHVPDVPGILKRNNILRGTRLMTTDGQNLGTIIDLYFDEKSGAVERYEVSGGLWSDTYTGRSFVPAARTLKIGRDVAFVPPEVVQEMQQKVGGIKGAVQTAAERAQERARVAGERVQETASVARERFQENAGTAGRRWQETRDEARQKLQESTQHTRERFLDLTSSATERWQETQRAMAPRMADSFRATTEEAKTEARILWDKTQHTFNELKERNAQRQEEARIREAVGRPTGRVILDRGDNIILNVGDVITYEAVERARQAGVLDILLNSVNLKIPELNGGEARLTTR